MTGKKQKQKQFRNNGIGSPSFLHSRNTFLMGEPPGVRWFDNLQLKNV